MITTNMKKIAVGVAAASSLLLSAIALPVYAQGTNTRTASSTAAARVATQLAALIVKADKDIAARLTSLNDLNTKVQAMKNVSATEKTNITNEVQTNVTGLTALKAKIDGDTDIKVARTDAASIFGTFRIYALVIPQGYIEVSADRINTIGALMAALGSKLQTRITAAGSAGKDVSALQTALTDVATQTAAANAQALTAQNGVMNLIPDQGNSSIAASNKTALVAARANIRSAITYLKAARKDVQTITTGLKGFHLGGTATSTASH